MMPGEIYYFVARGREKIDRKLEDFEKEKQINIKYALELTKELEKKIKFSLPLALKEYVQPLFDELEIDRFSDRKYAEFVIGHKRPKINIDIPGFSKIICQMNFDHKENKFEVESIGVEPIVYFANDDDDVPNKIFLPECEVVDTLDFDIALWVARDVYLRYEQYLNDLADGMV